VFADAIADVALDVAVFLGTLEIERVKDVVPWRIGGDLFLDGSFGSHTAWLSEPYTSTPPPGSPPTGISYRDDDELFEFFVGAQRARMQVGVHAIGDAAIEQALRTWERAAAVEGLDSVRALGHRIEHFECSTDDHIARAAHLGVRASVQPAFDRYWGGPDGLYAQRIGWERARGMNRFATMSAAGVMLAAGSDSTVTPLDPFLQMASLRDHHVPGQSLSPAAALEAHTHGPAAVAGHAHVKGALAPGLQADLALLDRDPLVVDGDALLGTEVLGTWIAGARVWPRAEAEAT
jgi:predicted amidohydrolase YtcJ